MTSKAGIVVEEIRLNTNQNEGEVERNALLQAALQRYVVETSLVKGKPAAIRLALQEFLTRKWEWFDAADDGEK